MNQDLKHLITRALDFSESINNVLKIPNVTDSELRKVIQFELIFFVAYLSASDGIISHKETQFIEDYLELTITPQELNELIQEQNIYSVEFEKKLPTTFETFVLFDNTIIDLGVEVDDYSSELMLRVYELVGKEFVSCDEDTSSSEESDFNIYMGMLRSYVRKNLKKKDTDVILNYTKQGAGVIAPAKSGDVVAPKKKR